MKKNKVMLLNFPLLDVGGIVTWSHQIQKGFAKIGIQADHYYCTPTGNYKCDENDFVPIGGKFKRGEKIPSKTLGFYGPENLAYYEKLQDEYDYIIFIHPSPHPTKANKKDIRMHSWTELYERAKIPVIVIFHDMKWHKTNPWFIEVSHHIDCILAAQHNFIESVNHYCESTNSRFIKTDWLYFPIDMDGVEYINPKNKDKRLGMFPQWIKWKNHEKLIKVAKDVVWPIHFYNGGMEYHNITKKRWSDWQSAIRIDWVEDEYVNKEAKHEYHGFITYEKVKEAYKKSLGAIDLTTRTYQNYTHHESCLYGATLLCTEECRQGPYNHIYENEYWPVDIDNISKSINSFCQLSLDSMHNIAYAANVRTRENFECSKIALKIHQIAEVI